MISWLRTINWLKWTGYQELTQTQRWAERCSTDPVRLNGGLRLDGRSQAAGHGVFGSNWVEKTIVQIWVAVDGHNMLRTEKGLRLLRELRELIKRQAERTFAIGFRAA
jgi:hypothetical protein